MSMIETLAARHLASLSPAQIAEGLPKWLADLRPDQFDAAFEVALAEYRRRGGRGSSKSVPGATEHVVYTRPITVGDVLAAVSALR